MRFISFVKAGQEFEQGRPPSPALMQAMGALMAEGFQQGYLVEVGGLLPTAMGARVKAEGGKVSVTDGPFAEFKELIGGYAILEAESKAKAIEYARKFMQLHIDVLGPEYEGECEVRQLFEAPPCV